MISFCLLILCLNIDALSYGIAYGVKQIKLNFLHTFLMSLISTAFFATALWLSKYIYQILNPKTCEIVNGIFLILLGIFYLFPKKDTEKTPQIFSKQNFKTSFLECFVFSIDAIFTAFLSGFFGNLFIFFVFFYFLTNFFAIFLGNLFFYKLGKLLTFKIDFLSCFIFILLGFFKII